jgi:hypothetical protein
VCCCSPFCRRFLSTAVSRSVQTKNKNRIQKAAPRRPQPGKLLINFTPPSRQGRGAPEVGPRSSHSLQPPAGSTAKQGMASWPWQGPGRQLQPGKNRKEGEAPSPALISRPPRPAARPGPPNQPFVRKPPRAVDRRLRGGGGGVGLIGKRRPTRRIAPDAALRAA